VKLAKAIGTNRGRGYLKDRTRKKRTPAHMEDEMDEACSMHGSYKKCIESFSSET
jgi:hypothetical protein